MKKKKVLNKTSGAKKKHFLLDYKNLLSIRLQYAYLNFVEQNHRVIPKQPGWF